MCVKCGVQSVNYIKNRVQSVDCIVRCGVCEREARSVKCRVWSLTCEVWGVKCGA